MEQLKLIALDDEDLVIISAAMQDAVIKVEDLHFDAKAGQFLCAVNRFVWENKSTPKGQTHERRRSQIAFKRVKNVKLKGINRTKPDDVLSLLSIKFEKHGDGPEGHIELVMSGQSGILLDVECIEVQLTDTGGAWATQFKPKH